MKDEARETREPTTLDEALVGAIAKALESESLQKRVEDAVEGMVEQWVKDAFGHYASAPRKAFEKRMGELVVPAIERMSMDNARLDVLLSTLVSETVVGERAQLLEKFGKLVCTEKRESAPASEIFKKWCEYVAESYDCTGREVEDGEYEYLECTCDFVVNEHRASDYKTAVLRLDVDNADDEQRETFGREISLYRWRTLPRDEDLWFVHYPPRPEIGSIARMSDFDVMLAQLSLSHAKLLDDIDAHGIGDCVAPEASPEYELR